MNLRATRQRLGENYQRWVAPRTLSPRTWGQVALLVAASAISVVVVGLGMEEQLQVPWWRISRALAVPTLLVLVSWYVAPQVGRWSAVALTSAFWGVGTLIAALTTRTCMDSVGQATTCDLATSSQFAALAALIPLVLFAGSQPFRATCRVLARLVCAHWPSRSDRSGRDST